MAYQSIFGPIGTDDHGDDVLCLSRGHGGDPFGDTLREYYTVFLEITEVRDNSVLVEIGQPAFFLARQIAEIGLKSLYGEGYEITHCLEKLLDNLRRSSHPIFADSDNCDLVDFMLDINSHDAKGVEGRYPVTLDGMPSLSTACCVDRQKLIDYTTRLYVYVQANRKIGSKSAISH